jgi:DNA-binding NtrC family response regulator
MMKARKILIIEDEHALGSALSIIVRRMGHLPELAATATAGLKMLAEAEIAALVLDIGLPDMSGLEVLRRLRDRGQAPPVLVITAHATLDHAIDAQKSGATAYLTKPLDLRSFELTLAALLATAHVNTAKVAETPSVTLIGAAPCLREAFVGIARACAGNMPALITGPSGAGKSLAATVIHAHGPQAMRPLKAISSSEIRDASVFLDSDCGTLVLDEITSLEQSLQTQLARLLADPRPQGPRLLATSSLDPTTAMRDGVLREDLYYALATLTIPLPPLRDRSGDIPALSAFFAGMRDASTVLSITHPAMTAMQAYPWPGNVRELKHVIDYAGTLSGGGPVFLSHLPPQIAAAAGAESTGPPPGELDAAVRRWLDATLTTNDVDPPDYDTLAGHLESLMLRHLLEIHQQKPTRLAAALRIHRATLRQKLRRMGLQGDD